MFIEGTITTKVGQVNFTLTSPDHVHLCTGPMNVAESHQATYRGKHYYGSLHLNRKTPGGAWEAENPYIKKWGVCGDDAPPTHRQAIIDAYIEAWTAHAQSDPNLMLASHEESASRARATLVAKIEDARKALTKAEQDLTDHDRAMVVRRARFAH